MLKVKKLFLFIEIIFYFCEFIYTLIENFIE